MRVGPVRYTSDVDDNTRWLGFPFRDGDIVISTRSKSGATWVQMICALLIFRMPTLPAPLAELSPWLDWMITPRDEAYAHLAAQSHRRFIKSHTPLDGLPMDSRATFIVVARHPLDMAVSLYHQSANMDRARVNELVGVAPPQPRQPPLPVHDWLLDWVDRDVAPGDQLDSLPGVLWHLTDAWQRRDEPNVILVHFDDLVADLSGQMRRLAELLQISIPDERWPELVDAATFEQMSVDPARSVPDPAGVLKDKAAFFRVGSSGAGAEVLTPEELEHYHVRTAQLAPPDLLTWLHRSG